MRKVIKNLGELASFILIFSGFIVCMCETENLDKQLMTLCIGAVLIILGALLGGLSKGEEEYGYR